MKIKQFIKHQINEETFADKEQLLSLEQRLLSQVTDTHVGHNRQNYTRFTPMYMTRFVAMAVVVIVLFFAGMTLLPQANNPILKQMQNSVGIQQVSAEVLVKAVQEALSTQRLHYIEKEMSSSGANTASMEVWVDRTEKKVRREMKQADGSLQHMDIGFLFGTDYPRTYDFILDHTTKEGIFSQSEHVPGIETLIEHNFIEATGRGLFQDATVDKTEYNSKTVYKLVLRTHEGKVWRVMMFDTETHLPIFSETYSEQGDSLGITNYEFIQDNFTDSVFELTAPKGYTLMQDGKVTEFSLYPTAITMPTNGTPSHRYGFQVKISNGISTVTLADGFPAGYTQKIYVSLTTYGTAEDAASATDVIMEPLSYERPAYIMPPQLTYEIGTGAYARFKLAVLDKDGNTVYELDRVAPLHELTSPEKFNSAPNLPEYFTIFTPVENK